MLRPYIALTWALADYDDPMHVIWHDNKRVQRNGRNVWESRTNTDVRPVRRS